MELKDIGTKELKKLNLYPIHGFNQLKTYVEYGYCEIYLYKKSGEKRTKHDTTFRPRYSTPTQIYEDFPDSDFWIFEKRIDITDFDSISDEELISMGFTMSSLCKLQWLKKYLKGEVNGTYSKFEDLSFREIISSKEILEQDKTIRNLNERIYELQVENLSLRNIIEQNKKEILNAEKTKEKYKKLLLELETILENVKTLTNNID